MWRKNCLLGTGGKSKFKGNSGLERINQKVIKKKEKKRTEKNVERKADTQ